MSQVRSFIKYFIVDMLRVCRASVEYFCHRLQAVISSPIVHSSAVYSYLQFSCFCIIGHIKNVSLSPLGLPATGSWQDLKDHMREAGDVCYADVYKDGTGVVEFLRYEDMKYAARKLDDSKFRSHEVMSGVSLKWLS